MKTTRRSFLKTVAAASAVPFIVPASVWGAEVKPSNKIVMGFIGMGKQNRGLLDNFLNQPDVQVVASVWFPVTWPITSSAASTVNASSATPGRCLRLAITTVMGSS